MQHDDVFYADGTYREREMPRQRPGELGPQMLFDLQEFAYALNQGAFERALLYVDGARDGFFGANEWMTYWSERMGENQLRVHRLQIERLEGDEAEVILFYTANSGYHVYVANNMQRESLRVRRRSQGEPGQPAGSQGLWGITPGPGAEVLNLDARSQRKAAFFLRQPPGIVELMRADQSQFRLKKLACIAHSFFRDYDESFAFAPEYFREALGPYVHGAHEKPGIFEVPGTRESYTFNARLSAQPQSVVTQPMQTVMFYEGQDEKPVARYNGQAVICFTAGNVAMVDEAQIDSLNWEP